VGQYRAVDAVNPPSLISWARVPLAAAFPFAIEDPTRAVLVLLAAGASDVADGWVARSTGRVTPMGAVIDPITDKVFVFTVVATLVATHRLPLASVLLLGTREIGEAPLVLWYAASRRLRRGRVRAPMANWTGKGATVLQFATVMLAIVESRYTKPFLFATAAAGTLAAASYLRRALAARARG
jgi:CDP-diacylglycerol--glycerol-3-phosphate 3-phosphatidyltransferase/cardiolipin synthase